MSRRDGKAESCEPRGFFSILLKADGIEKKLLLLNCLSLKGFARPASRSSQTRHRCDFLVLTRTKQFVRSGQPKLTLFVCAPARIRTRNNRSEVCRDIRFTTGARVPREIPLG